MGYENHSRMVSKASKCSILLLAKCHVYIDCIGYLAESVLRRKQLVIIFGGTQTSGSLIFPKVRSRHIALFAVSVFYKPPFGVVFKVACKDDQDHLAL